MAEDCSWYDLVCSGKEVVSESVSQGAQSGLQSLADGVTAGAIKIVTTVGTMWVRTPTPALDGVETPISEPTRGTFNAQVDLALSNMAWIGLAVAVLGIILLGAVVAVNARRGDGAGFVNKATIIMGGVVLISGAVSIGSFLVPQRSTNMSGSIAFLQDQTVYLTMALAVVSLIIAGISMVWSHRAEPAQEVLKGLLTLATVTVAGVTFISILTKGTDALATQIVDAAIGEDFGKDLLRLLSLHPQGNSDPAWLGGSVVLVILGGIVAILVDLFQLMLMALRTGMLFLLAGLLPLAASFTSTAKGKQFFEKTVGWTLAFAFYKPAAAAIYALAIKMTTTGMWEGGGGDGIMQFCAGLMMVIASIAALPVLIGFMSPLMSAMGSSGGAGAMGMAALGATIPGGASRMGRSGQGLGDGAIPSQEGKASQKQNASPAAGGKAASKGAASSGAAASGAKGAASGAAAGAAGAATGGLGAAASAVSAGIKKAQGAVVAQTEAASGEETNGSQAPTSKDGGAGTSGKGHSGPGTGAQDQGARHSAASKNATQDGKGASTPSGSRAQGPGHSASAPVGSRSQGSAQGAGSPPSGASRSGGGTAPSGTRTAAKPSPAPKHDGMTNGNNGPEEGGPHGANRN